MNKRIIAFGALLTASPWAFGMGNDDPIIAMVKIDQLEWRNADEDTPLVLEADAWLGKDLQKLWLKTEVERVDDETEELVLELYYSQAFAPYWDWQVGVRRDFKPEPDRDWLALGVIGLAPYFFEIDTSLYFDAEGRSALSFSAEYELMLTQRLVLVPEFELNAYGKDDLPRGIKAGFSDASFSARLGYEIRREFAPYIGINWNTALGGSADLLDDAGEETSEAEFVIGLRAWL